MKILRALRVAWDFLWVVIICGGAIALVVVAWRGNWVYGLVIAALMGFILFVAWTVDRDQRRNRQRADWVDEQMTHRPPD